MPSNPPSLQIIKNPYDPVVWSYHLFLAILSALVSAYELLRWGTAKASGLNSEPKYPLKWLMLADALLVVCFVLVFFGELSVATQYRWQGFDAGLIVLEAYSTLAVGAMVVLHACCFWKQLMALKRAGWLRGLPLVVDCPHCTSTLRLTFGHRVGDSVAACQPREPLDMDIEGSRESEALLTPTCTTYETETTRAGENERVGILGYGTLAGDTGNARKSKTRKEKTGKRGEPVGSRFASLGDVGEQNLH